MDTAGTGNDENLRIRRAVKGVLELLADGDHEESSKLIMDTLKDEHLSQSAVQFISLLVGRLGEHFYGHLQELGPEARDSLITFHLDPDTD